MRILFAFLVCMASVLPVWGDEGVAFLSYNIRNGIGMDRVTDFNRTIATIRGASPEIVCIQELDSATVRSKGRYVLGLLADSLNMHATYAPAIDFDGGKYGIGMLSRACPISTKTVALPGREEARMLLIAEFDDCVVACTHLSLTPDDQLLSIPIIEREAAGWNKPFILAGDLNCVMNSPTFEALSREFQVISQTTSPTFPSDKPERLIDHILVHKSHAEQVKVSDAHAIGGTIASDHIPQYIRIGIAR